MCELSLEFMKFFFFACKNTFRGEEKWAGIYFHMKTGTVLQTKLHEVVHINHNCELRL